MTTTINMYKRLSNKQEIMLLTY